MTAKVPTRTVPRIVVQTASNLGNSEWSTQRWLTCLEWSDGAGAVAGYAKLSQWYGLVARLLGPNTVEDIGISPNIDRAAAGSLVGKLVRVCLEDGSGTVSEQFPSIQSNGSGAYRVSYETSTFAPVWYGVIRSLSFSVDGSPDSPGGLAEFTAAGLSAALDQVFVDRGYVLGAAAGTVFGLGYCPPFNAVGTGDRSLDATYTVGANMASYVHDLRTVGDAGTAWTAAQILTFILSGHARPLFEGSPTGWEWLVSDPTDALTYTPAAIDLQGMSVLEAINALISPSRGLTWRLSVSGDTATINVHSTVAEPIVIGAAYTLPASTLSQSLTIANQPWLTDLQVTQDESASYDIIQVLGKQPWVAISLDYLQGTDSTLIKGWTTAQATAWDADKGSAANETVWRRFAVSQTWTGVQYDRTTKGLRNSRTVAGSGDEPDAAYGAGGLTGEREFVTTASTVFAPASMIPGERMTPIPAVIRDGSTTVERLAPRMAPMLFYYNGSSWTDISKVYTVSIESEPLAVVLDDNANGTDLKRVLSVTGAKLVVTLGAREADPLAVSWVAARPTWPSSLPRVKTVYTSAEQLAIVDKTVTKVASGTLVTRSATIIRDDVDRLRAQLALARATWATPVYSLRFTNRGICGIGDTAGTFPPGTLIPAVIDGAGSTTVNAIVLRRTFSWQGDCWATSIEAERVAPASPTF